ncbi:MAG: L,D-transpeptidase family protein [Pseudomonadota bacterium]
MRPLSPAITDRALALITAACDRPGAPERVPDRIIVVDVERQAATLIVEGTARGFWPVSTARNGIGGEENSYKTPPGWHTIHAKIGVGAEAGCVFVSREPHGDVWRGEECEQDLILTRILTLDGLEVGVNQGPGCDSRARYIYIHGTNHEALIGRPASCGCVRMKNADVTDLFEQAEQHDHVLIMPPEATDIPDLKTARFHYAGLGGSGMSALAQFQAMTGGKVSGSDRAFDKGERGDVRAKFEALGISVFPQDGSGIGEDCGALVVSTAVEETVPDYAEAMAHAVPVVHRSQMLAHFVANHRSIAITGTSGKSTVTGMTFEILRGLGTDPSVITGGDLPALQAQGLIGNAYAGASDLLVVEADESDGSLVRYTPSIGVILNLQRDHKEIDEVAAMFSTLRARTRDRLVVGDDENLDPFAGGALRFGLSERADIRGTKVEHGPHGARFCVGEVPFEIPVPGLHNVTNALGAIAAASAAGFPIENMAVPLSQFSGIGRRFQTIGAVRGIEVVDDFAHNAEKITAAIRTAKLRGSRVLAVYQPHGYGPTRFLWDDFVRTFSAELSADDLLFMLEIFYAGGTATRDFSAADIVSDIAARGANARFAPSRDWLIEAIAAGAQSGDVILVMGARDPSLTQFARDILAAVERA